MKILYETPVGYFLFKRDEKGNLLKLSTEKFYNISDAAIDFGSLQSGTLPEKLKIFIKENVKDEPLQVTDLFIGKLVGEAIPENKINCSCEYDIIRSVREQLHNFLDISKEEYFSRVAGLAHKMGNSVLKNAPERMDTIVVESINLLEELDRDINIHVMRIKEWYGFHFPELDEVIGDNLNYVNAVITIGNRKNAQEALANSERKIFSEKTIQKMVESARISMGADITEEDCARVISDAKSVVRMYEYRNELNEYLAEKIRALTPNVVALVGEVIAAKLLSKSGSLFNMSKLPASTIQIMGAERSLFNAIKNKGDTPKYGFIYNSPLISRASPALKGKIARSLAAKLALASKIDTFKGVEDTSGDVGIAARRKLEERLQFMEAMNNQKKNPQRMKKHHFKPTYKYDEKQDISNYTKRQKTKEDKSSTND